MTIDKKDETSVIEALSSRLINSEFRNGYAYGFAEAVALLADACGDVATGIMTIDEFLVIATTRWGEVGDALNRSRLAL